MSNIKKDFDMDALDKDAFLEALNDHIIAQGNVSKKVILKIGDYDRLMASDYIHRGLKVDVVRRRQKTVEVNISYEKESL